MENIWQGTEHTEAGKLGNRPQTLIKIIRIN